MEKLPDLFDNRLVDSLDDVEFSQRWHDLMRTWMPTVDQLVQLSSNDIEAMAFAPLPATQDQQEFVLAIRRRNLAGLEHGRRQGWWQAFTEDGPLPSSVCIKASDFHGKTMAHIMADAGFFPSVGQARKNGWDRPVTLGIFKVGKTKTLEVIE